MPMGPSRIETKLLQAVEVREFVQLRRDGFRLTDGAARLDRGCKHAGLFPDSFLAPLPESARRRGASRQHKADCIRHPLGES